MQNFIYSEIFTKGACFKTDACLKRTLLRNQQNHSQACIEKTSQGGQFNLLSANPIVGHYVREITPLDFIYMKRTQGLLSIAEKKIIRMNLASTNT